MTEINVIKDIMSYWDKKLLREQLDDKLRQFKSLNHLQNGTGWIKIIRESLSMTTKQLAKKAGIGQPRISRIENNEGRGNLKISTLEKGADALDMKFVYGFIPRDSLEKLVNEQARKVALDRLKTLSHTMSLEDQQLKGKDAENALQDMIQKILIENPKDFWDK